MGLKLKTGPTTEPLTTAEAKAFLRVDHSDEDTIIDNLILAARQMAEDFTRRSFITQTWTLFLDFFPRNRTDKWWDGTVQAHRNTIHGLARIIQLSRPPLISVTHLKTYGDDNVAVTFSSANYIVDINSCPARIILENGQTWPTVLRAGNGVEIEFVTGYGAASAVPNAIKQAILMTVAKMYECRGDEVLIDMPVLSQRLLHPYKILDLSEMNR